MYGSGGTAPPSLPAHHREFVYVSLLPSSCQEAPQRGTADCSVLWATPSRQEWMGFSAYSIRRRLLSHPRRSFHQFQNTHSNPPAFARHPKVNRTALYKESSVRKLHWNPKQIKRKRGTLWSCDKVCALLKVTTPHEENLKGIKLSMNRKEAKSKWVDSNKMSTATSSSSSE